MGKIFNDVGERMSPNYVVKKGVRYRYYLARSVVQGRKDSSSSLGRVPGEKVEAVVVRALRAALANEAQAAAMAKMTDEQLVTARLDRITLQRKSIIIARWDPSSTGLLATSFTWASKITAWAAILCLSYFE